MSGPDFPAALSRMRTDSLYATLGVEAIWTPAGGTPVTFRALSVMADQMPEVAGLGRQIVPARILRIQVSDFAAAAQGDPRKGDRFEVGGETFTVLAGPRKEDNRRLEWTIPLGTV